MRNTRALHDAPQRSITTTTPTLRRTGLVTPLSPVPTTPASPRVLLVEENPELANALLKHLGTLGFEGLDTAYPAWAPELLADVGRLSAIVTGPWIEDDHRLALFVFARRIAPEARRIALVPATGPKKVPLAHITLPPPWSTDALGPALGLAWAFADR